MAKFSGFPRQYFTFFNQLKKNNTRDWFEKHRSDYDEFVLHPAREFVTEMGKKLRQIAPGVNAIPKINQSLFKINRDVRFSKDKSPYKTYMGIWLWEGNRKRMESSGEALKELNPGYIVPTHCTGRKAAMLIEKEMPGKFLLNMSGTKMIFATQ